MTIIDILKFIIQHPLSSNRKFAAIVKFVKWQIGCRLVGGSVAVPFVGDSRLLVAPGMAGASGNLYTGLHEFEDMSFVLHVLRENDCFIDIGANIGSYTIMAAGVAKARCISFEPVPHTFKLLKDNINLNDVTALVSAQNLGIGKQREFLKFTIGFDCINHVLSNSDIGVPSVNVPVVPLDESVGSDEPFLIKIDVEGFETNVIEGASKVLSSKNLSGVIMELNGSGDRYGFSEEKLHAEMMKYGFGTYKYLPFSRELVSLEGKTAGAGNTLYLRNLDDLKMRLKSAPKFKTNNGWEI